ncbi:MAG: methionine--tRNA ligase [Gemmataceae bacterium]|nr:methionine--tRNA ligase [Gemmataceae bacterium]
MEKRFYITTAIDYPNSRPHIGTAFEKIGADVQARYRRMEGYAVHFLMGNDENTVKVAKRAAELGQDPKAYCDDMAGQFKEVWRALDISFDDFIQTSEPRHHAGCQKFIQKVHDNGFIYKAKYEGLYCEGCEAFKTESDIKDAGGVCPDHKVPPIRRSEPCYFFAQSKFQERLLKLYEERPDFIQPESRRNEVVNYVKGGLQDVNITRTGEAWGIRVPFDPEFTIYVWFDALLNYITAIGYGSDEQRFNEWWPADIHFIGKDITRFHCALWPAMLLAADVEPPRMVFGHGFVYSKGEKISKTLGNIVEPMEIITKFSSEAFRYYFMRECPFPGDGDFTWQRFREVFNADLANKFGNLYSRVVTLMTMYFGGTLDGTAEKTPSPIHESLVEFVRQVKSHMEACQYNQALEKIWRQVVDPANQFTDRRKPWELAKTDKDATKEVLFALAESLRVASILIRPFLPRTAETIYRSFNFTKPFETVSYADAASSTAQKEDLRVIAQFEGGTVKPMFPRIK